MSDRSSKYDSLSRKCFGVDYLDLDADDQILIRDLFDERNE